MRFWVNLKQQNDILLIKCLWLSFTTAIVSVLPGLTVQYKHLTATRAVVIVCIKHTTSVILVPRCVLLVWLLSVYPWCFRGKVFGSVYVVSKWVCFYWEQEHHWTVKTAIGRSAAWSCYWATAHPFWTPIATLLGTSNGSSSFGTTTTIEHQFQGVCGPGPPRVCSMDQSILLCALTSCRVACLSLAGIETSPA